MSAMIDQHEVMMLPVESVIVISLTDFCVALLLVFCLTLICSIKLLGENEMYIIIIIYQNTFESTIQISY